MYSGRAAYVSGVKHQGKIPCTIISGTLARAWAMICQPWTTTRRNGSVASHALCSDRDFTRSGVLARQPHADCRAQGQPEDVGLADPRGLHERGDVVGEQLGGVDALRLARQARAAGPR
jgi:hypothetical protein